MMMKSDRAVTERAATPKEAPGLIRLKRFDPAVKTILVDDNRAVP